MKKLFTAAAAGLMLGASQMAAAETGLGVKLGTLGYGAEFTYGINKSFNARLGLNSYSYSETDTQDDIEYDMDMDWQTTGAFLDWHPFEGSFRLSLGYMFNKNEIGMEAVSTSEYEVGGTTYSREEIGTLNGSVNFGDGLFYGLGWGNAGDGKGLGFIFELGMLQQSPELSLEASGPVSNLESFQQDLQREERDAQQDLEEFDQYPVISLGLSYSF